MVNLDIDLGIIPYNDDWFPKYDWGGLLFMLMAIYLIVLHLIVAYFLGRKLVVRMRAWLVVPTSEAATQLPRLPEVPATAVEGLLSELRSRGLRTTGLRAELEHRLLAWQAESEQ